MFRALSLHHLLIAAALVASLVPLVILLALGLWEYQTDSAALARITAATSLSGAQTAAYETLRPLERFFIQALAIVLLSKAAAVSALAFGRSIAERYNAVTDELKARLEENQSFQEELEAQNEELHEQAERNYQQTLELARQKTYNELILNAAEDGILGLDREGKVTFANPAAARLLGYEPGALLGLRAHQVLRPAAAHQSKDISACPFRATLNQGRSWRSPSETGLRKDGSSFPAEYALAPVYEGEEVVGAVMTFRDITDRLEAERAARLEFERTTAIAHATELEVRNAALLRLSEEAQAANRLKSEFLATMSHELRTPLNSVIGYTDLVLNHQPAPLDDKTRKYLGVVLRNGKHLLELINDVLDLSRVEADRVTLRPEPLDPARVLGAVQATTTPLARDRKLSLTVSTDPALTSVVVDETKLRQIVLNLVSNAIKFTPAGQVTVTAAPEGADRWTVKVRDTGIGIAPDHQELIFDAFRQVDGATNRQVGGTGLGLAIARKLARLMGGDVRVESALGEGSTFTLELPRQPVPDSAIVADGREAAAGA